MWRMAGNWEPWTVVLYLELKYRRASWRGSGRICGIGPNISHHLRSQDGMGAVELFVKHYELWMIIILVLEEHDFFKGVHIVIITIIEFWTFVICELPKRGGMSPFLAAGESCDDELVIEDFWGVPIFVHNIFYMSRLFLSKDALIEFDVFPWVFWEKMPSFGQYFLWQS